MKNRDIMKKTRMEANFMTNTVEDIVEQFERKNVDYGDSMGVQCQEWGDITPIVIRMGDKMNRTRALVKNKSQLVSDESLQDTLIDLVTYGLMALYELESMREEEDEEEEEE